jgi:hypothetical protein
MKNLEYELQESIKRADIFFDSRYFNEAILEYKKAMAIGKELDSKYLEKIKSHILYIFEKKACCYNELRKHMEVVETYLKILKFLNKYFTKNEKLDFAEKNYRQISFSINELYIEADLAQQNFNYNQALLFRKKAAMLVEMISVYTNDLLFYKYPNELLKEADLYKLIGDFVQAENTYKTAIDVSLKYYNRDLKFIKNFAEEAFGRIIAFYDDIENFEKTSEYIQIFINLLEKSYDLGETIDFIKIADLYVKKSLFIKNLSHRHCLLNKAGEYYNYADTEKIKDNFFYYVYYVEINLFISLDNVENYEFLEQICETFLKNSIKNFAMLYYLKSLRLLLQSYFTHKKLFRIFKIEKNLHINKEMLGLEEKEIYQEIQIFLKGCKSILEFQKNIYEHHNDLVDTNAQNLYENFEKLYKSYFIDNHSFAILIYFLFTVYNFNIKNKEKSCFYLNKIWEIYEDRPNDLKSTKLYALCFEELAKLYTEKQDYTEAMKSIEVSLDLYRILFKDKKDEYAIKLHNILLLKSNINCEILGECTNSIEIIKEAIEVLEDNIESPSELIKVINAISLKSSLEEKDGKNNKALENYLGLFEIYEKYSFINIGNLDKIYAETLQKGMNLALSLDNKEIYNILKEKQNNIQLIKINYL